MTSVLQASRVYTLFCGFLTKEEDTYFSHLHSGFGYMICLATGMVVDMIWPKTSKANAQWAYRSFFDYCHENIMLRWARCPLAWSLRRRMRYTYSEATTTDLQTHELNKCYYLMPHWFYSVWLHSIIVTIANWYNHLLAIWHPASCFTFLKPGFLINKRKQFFTVCGEDHSWSIVFCTHKMFKNDKFYVITIFTNYLISVIYK